MKFLKRLYLEDDGQALVEYTLVVLLVAVVFWLAVRNTGVAGSLADGWSKVLDCVTSPASCSG